MPEPTNQNLDLIYTLDGDRAPHSRTVLATDKVGDVVKTTASELGREDLEALFPEDTDKPVTDKTTMATLLAGAFQVFHIGAKSKVKVEVGYNGREAREPFPRGATIQAIVAWAISPKGLNLQGEGCDFQLKLGKDLLPPDLHVGQISSDRDVGQLTLVFKIKPQG